MIFFFLHNERTESVLHFGPKAPGLSHDVRLQTVGEDSPSHRVKISDLDQWLVLSPRYLFFHPSASEMITSEL